MFSKENLTGVLSGVSLGVEAEGRQVSRSQSWWSSSPSGELVCLEPGWVNVHSASVTAQIPSLELQGESPGAAHKWSGTDTPSLLPAEQ